MHEVCSPDWQIAGQQRAVMAAFAALPCMSTQISLAAPTIVMEM
jgi:hypothetical protein